MVRKLSFKIPKKFQAVLIFLAIVLAAYFLIRILPSSAQKVPAEFLEAKYNASSIAQGIVTLSKDLTKNLEEINRLDSEKKYSDAINLLTQEIDRNKETKNKAINLSEELSRMALAVPNISPASDSQVALQAISSETALISHLIVYNDYLNQLLEELRLKLLGKNTSSSKIQDLILKINEEVKTINELNIKFNSLMDKFDGKGL